MADKRKAPQGSDAARKRKAPTIDLTATDVTPPQGAPEPDSAPEPAPGPASAAAADIPPEPPPPPPPDEPPQAAAEPEAMPPIAVAAGEERRGTPISAMLLAGVAGGVIVAAVLGGLWYAGALPQPQAQVQPDPRAQQQMAQLQREIDTLKNRPAPAVDTRATDALAQRVAQLETVVKNRPAGATADPQLAQKLTELQNAITPLTQRLASAESAIKSGDTAVSTLNKRIDDIAGNASQARADADASGKTVAQLDSQVKDLARNQASTVTRADIDAVQQKLSSLEQAEQAARASIRQSAAATSATRLALAAQALRNAVTGGAPYAAELAQAKSLGADADKLASLEPFAASGVPSTVALSQQLRALVPQMQKIAAPHAQASGTFLERLQANAGNLVRVSPVNAPSGDAPADVLAHLEAEAARSDIAAAAADIGKLPEAVQTPAKEWVTRVKARQAALAAADDLAAASTRALSQGAQ